MQKTKMEYPQNPFLQFYEFMGRIEKDVNKRILSNEKEKWNEKLNEVKQEYGKRFLDSVVN